MSMLCQHSEKCAACPWMPIPYAEQRQRKINALSEGLAPVIPGKLPDIQFLSVGDSSLRDRADLVAFEQGYGLYGRDKTLFPVEQCPQLSDKLFAFYQELKSKLIPFKDPAGRGKGSLRLRVSTEGHRGLWLDFSHQDTQHLFLEQSTLHNLLAMAYVEFGQRHKKLVWDGDENRFRLKDPEFHPWTRTWVGDLPVPLYAVVGGFSQSSDHANQIIIAAISGMFSRCGGGGRWIEFGCGNGNLTFPLAAYANQVLALEYEGLAVEGLQKTLQSLSHVDSLAHLTKKIQARAGNFHQAMPDLFADSVQGILVNPPRSGLKNFLDPLRDLPTSSRPKDFVYMSCFLESFIKDAQDLVQLGYSNQELCIIDQFPQSPHFEILSRWSL